MKGKIKMEQEKLRKQLKVAKMNNNWFSYGDIADLLEIKVGSLYNFLAGAYNLSQTKARILRNWLIDLQDQEDT